MTVHNDTIIIRILSIVYFILNRYDEIFILNGFFIKHRYNKQYDVLNRIEKYTDAMVILKNMDECLNFLFYLLFVLMHILY
ncbi:hypothetical protein BBI00_14420 [Chryseobacterium arthrosphaerae]|uniref:Uncharacterized protein n=1 Tax=Chryseobacterium arthrosphaerae TaxID=651561 RepID=A0A1B8ZV30_9FLAO|nr:hypothetical protein BBI00_14420 [Chryseobacterium arthrosphaerae]